MKQNTKLNLLVIGATGMLGRSVFQFFKKKKEFIVYGTYLNCGNPDTDDLFKVDITNESEIIGCLAKTSPNIIINCSAIVNIDYCELNPDEAFNIHSESIKILARHAPNAKFVYISTDSVFNGIDGNYAETDAPNPLNVYAKSKYAGEVTTSEYFDKNIIVRTNIFGFNIPRKASLVEWALGALNEGNKISGFNDVIFNPVYVGQLAHIINQLLELSYNGIINVGSVPNLSKYSFLVKVAKIFELDCTLIKEVSIDSYPIGILRPKNTTLHLGKLQTSIGNLPTIDEGINNLFNDFKHYK